MNLKWIKCGDDGHWCNFLNLNLDSVNAVGVYVIWHGGDNPRAVRVGQGDVAARLAEHKENNDIVRHQNKGKLYVTWASVSSQANRDGIERFLAEKYSPLEGERFPDVPAIAVNLF